MRNQVRMFIAALALSAEACCFDCAPQATTGIEGSAMLAGYWDSTLSLKLVVDPSWEALCGEEVLDQALQFWSANIGEDRFRKAYGSFQRQNSVNAEPNAVYLKFAFEDESYELSEKQIREYRNSVGDPNAPVPLALGMTVCQNTPFRGPNLIDKCSIAIRSCSWIVLAHELGHALGFSHSDDPYNMMYIRAGKGTDQPYILPEEIDLLSYTCENP